MPKKPRDSVPFPLAARATSAMTLHTARRLITRSGARSRGRFPSLKTIRPAQYESQLELAALRVLEIASVQSYDTQPARIKDLSSRRLRGYTPDVYIHLGNDQFVLAEIKPLQKLLDDEIRDHLRVVYDGLAQRHIKLIFLTDTDLLQHDLQGRLSLLLRDRLTIPAAQNKRVVEQDPHGDHPSCNTHHERWRLAQQECDDLVARAIQRDFSQVVAEATAYFDPLKEIHHATI